VVIQNLIYEIPDNLNLSLDCKSIIINKAFIHFIYLHKLFPPPIMFFLTEPVQCICRSPLKMWAHIAITQKNIFFSLQVLIVNIKNLPLYLFFFGSLFTTAIVNSAKWLHPTDVWEKELERISLYVWPVKNNFRWLYSLDLPQTWEKLVMISNTKKQRQMVTGITTMGIN